MKCVHDRLKLEQVEKGPKSQLPTLKYKKKKSQMMQHRKSFHALQRALLVLTCGATSMQGWRICYCISASSASGKKTN